MTTFRTIDSNRYSLYMFDFAGPVGFRWPRLISTRSA